MSAYFSLITTPLQTYSLLFDDALISLRYAANLADGHGLVWNYNDYTQGYTNLGWVLVMSVLCRLSPARELTGGLVIGTNALLHAALAMSVFATVQRCTNRSLAAALAGVCTLISQPILFWGFGGMETTLLALLVLWATNFVYFRSYWLEPDTLTPSWVYSLMLFGVACVVRLDSAIFLGVAIFNYALLGAPFRKLCLGALVATSVIVAVLAFQFSYYGHLLPNTFALKASLNSASTTRGLRYLGDFLAQGEGIMLLAAWFALWAQMPTQRRALLSIGILLLSWTGYVVLLGGDAFPRSRFFVPIIPVSHVLVGLALARWDYGRISRDQHVNKSVPNVALVVAGLGLCFAYAFTIARGISKSPEHQFQRDMVAIAETIKASKVPRLEPIATFLAGTVPYLLPDRNFHDALGKVNRFIARQKPRYGPPGHSKWNFDYSLGIIKPALIIVGEPFSRRAPRELLEKARSRADYGFNGELLEHPTFRTEYLPHLVGTKSKYIELYASSRAVSNGWIVNGAEVEQVNQLRKEN